MAAATLGWKATNVLGLEGFPCADAAGGLNGCGAAVAIVSGLCFCEGGFHFDGDGDDGDTADM